MGLASLLFDLLTTGAGLAASSAVGEFAKGAGKAALDALTARLTGTHGVKSLRLLESAGDNPAFATAIRSELAKPAIAQDAELRRLMQALEAAIEALPAAETAPYAVKIREIRAGRDLLFENVEGVVADTATSAGDVTFKGIKAPGKR